MDRRRTQISEIWVKFAIFNHSSWKYGSHRLTGVRCVRRWCSHKIFSSTTAASLPAKLNWALTSQASWRPIMIRRYMFTYAIYPSYGGSIWKPGFSKPPKNSTRNVLFYPWRIPYFLVQWQIPFSTCLVGMPYLLVTNSIVSQNEGGIWGEEGGTGCAYIKCNSSFF